MKNTLRTEKNYCINWILIENERFKILVKSTRILVQSNIFLRVDI